MKRIALGFDVRIAPDRQSSRWFEARREDFLLLKSVAAPLSVDPDVWPPVLPFKGVSSQEFADKCLSASVKGRSERQTIFGFWDDVVRCSPSFLTSALTHVDSGRSRRKLWITIAR